MAEEGAVERLEDESLPPRMRNPPSTCSLGGRLPLGHGGAEGSLVVLLTHRPDLGVDSGLRRSGGLDLLARGRTGAGVAGLCPDP